MQWLFRRIIERILLKLMSLVGFQWEAMADMHFSEARAEMLRKASRLEAEDVPGLESVAAELRMRAEQLGQRKDAPAGDVLLVASDLKDEDLSNPDLPGIAHDEKSSSAAATRPTPSASASKKKRGRPRKNPLPDEVGGDED